MCSSPKASKHYHATNRAAVQNHQLNSSQQASFTARANAAEERHEARRRLEKVLVAKRQKDIDCEVSTPHHSSVVHRLLSQVTSYFRSLA